MAEDPFLGEIKIFALNFAPRHWALCNGQLLPIAQNQALFALLGTTYGGNGQTTFALPDLRGHVAAHEGNAHTLGERFGEQAHTLSVSELPQHTHALRASSAAATTNTPSNARVLAQASGAALYGPPSNPVAMAPGALSNVGGSQAHLNMQPFLALTFCIALIGIFPSQT
jgi:microcystin-dependent protein